MSKYTAQQARNAKGLTDWKKLESLTDADIKKAALSDLDAKPLSNQELTQFKPLRLLRHKLKL